MSETKTVESILSEQEVETRWIVGVINENTELIKQVSNQHRVPAEAVIGSALVEGTGSIDQILQKPKGDNTLQDRLATLWNCGVASDKLLFAIVAIAGVKYKEELNPSLSRRKFLKLAGLATSAVALDIVTGGYEGPNTKQYKIEVPEDVEKTIREFSPLLDRHFEGGIDVERSVGPAAIKPFEVQRLLSDPRIDITNPHTGEKINKEFWAKIIDNLTKSNNGYIANFVLGSFLEDSKWSFEFAAARAELAKLNYPEYAKMYNNQWGTSYGEISLDFDKLSEDDKLNYLHWASTIAKGRPQDIKTEKGETPGFGGVSQDPAIPNIHTFNVREILEIYKNQLVYYKN